MHNIKLFQQLLACKHLLFAIFSITQKIAELHYQRSTVSYMAYDCFLSFLSLLIKDELYEEVIEVVARNRGHDSN